MIRQSHKTIYIQCQKSNLFTSWLSSPSLSRKYNYRRRRQSLLINVQYDFFVLKRIAWRKAWTTIASSEKMCRSRSDTAHFAHDQLERNLFNVVHAFQCYSFFFFWRHFAGQLWLSSSTSNNRWTQHE